MLIVSLAVNQSGRIADIQIVRREEHGKLRNHYWYSFEAHDDKGGEFYGKVLHNYDAGPFALTQKVTKAIVAQQKAAREASK